MNIRKQLNLRVAPIALKVMLVVVGFVLIYGLYVVWQRGEPLFTDWRVVLYVAYPALTFLIGLILARGKLTIAWEFAVEAASIPMVILVLVLTSDYSTWGLLMKLIVGVPFGLSVVLAWANAVREIRKAIRAQTQVAGR